MKMKNKNDFVNSANIRIPYPDGTMYVIIDEDDETGKPYRLDVQVSKAGSSLAAWAKGLSECISLLWQTGVDTNKIIEMLSNISSGMPYRTTPDGIKIYSGPQAIQVALSKYLQWKKENKNVDFRERNQIRSNNSKIPA